MYCLWSNLVRLSFWKYMGRNNERDIGMFYWKPSAGVTDVHYFVYQNRQSIRPSSLSSSRSLCHRAMLWLHQYTAPCMTPHQAARNPAMSSAQMEVIHWAQFDSTCLGCRTQHLQQRMQRMLSRRHKWTSQRERQGLRICLLLDNDLPPDPTVLLILSLILFYFQIKR